ncbi:hypothetical protein FBU30_000405 [Linnemannia zychae]|nr:hypothetical protein FBU30_000405 [Linnemannia zychae]
MGNIFESNPYSKFYDLQTNVENFPRGLVSNIFTIPQNNTDLELNITPKVTKTIRSDFWGLFGAYDEKSSHSVSTTANAFTEAGKCVITVNTPGAVLNDTQFLVKTIPSAFSSWGGAASALWGVFYVLFGAGRADAFGLISKRLLRRTTQRHLTQVYGYWKPDTESIKQNDLAFEKSASASVQALHLSPASGMGTVRKDYMSAACSPHNSHEIATADANGELAIVFERLRQQDELITSQSMHIQMQEERIHKLKDNFHKMDGMLREYYLEMELASMEDPPVKHRRCW